MEIVKIVLWRCIFWTINATIENFFFWLVSNIFHQKTHVRGHGPRPEFGKTNWKTSGIQKWNWRPLALLLGSWQWLTIIVGGLSHLAHRVQGYLTSCFNHFVIYILPFIPSATFEFPMACYIAAHDALILLWKWEPSFAWSLPFIMLCSTFYLQHTICLGLLCGMRANIMAITRFSL